MIALLVLSTFVSAALPSENLDETALPVTTALGLTMAQGSVCVLTRARHSDGTMLRVRVEPGNSVQRDILIEDRDFPLKPGWSTVDVSTKNMIRHMSYKNGALLVLDEIDRGSEPHTASIEISTDRWLKRVTRIEFNVYSGFLPANSNIMQRVTCESSRR